ncbi:MAG: hypothetical protein U0R70_10335 [Solirubrobacteraceae bacterium]
MGRREGLGHRPAHSKFGLYECVEVKLIAWDPGSARNFWWHPYDETLGRAVRAAGGLLYGREADRRRALGQGAVPLAKVARRTLRSVGRR